MCYFFQKHSFSWNWCLNGPLFVDGSFPVIFIHPSIYLPIYLSDIIQKFDIWKYQIPRMYHQIFPTKFFYGINFNVTIHLDIWHLVTKCLACCLIYTRCIFHVDIFFNVHIFLCVFIMNNHLSINAHVPINSQII